MEQMDEGDDQSEDGLSASEDAEEDDEDDESGKSEDDDEETADKKVKIRQLASEIKALEGAIEKKRAGFTGGNPIIQVSSLLSSCEICPLIYHRNALTRLLPVSKPTSRSRMTLAKAWSMS